MNDTCSNGYVDLHRSVHIIKCVMLMNAPDLLSIDY